MRRKSKYTFTGFFLHNQTPMENQLFESRFLTLVLLEELPAVKIYWKAESEAMEEDDLYFEIENFITLLKKHGCSVGLADTSKYYQVLTPEIQERFNERIIPQYLEAGILAIAFITSEDFFTQLGLEQVLDEPNFRKISTRFFSDHDSAFNWLRNFADFAKKNV